MVHWVLRSPGTTPSHSGRARLHPDASRDDLQWMDIYGRRVRNRLRIPRLLSSQIIKTSQPRVEGVNVPLCGAC